MQTRFFEYFRISFFAHNFFIFENFSKISICVPPKPTLLYNFDFIKNFVSPTLKIDFFVICVVLRNTNISHYFWRKPQISPQRSRDTKKVHLSKVVDHGRFRGDANWNFWKIFKNEKVMSKKPNINFDIRQIVSVPVKKSIYGHETPKIEFPLKNWYINMYIVPIILFLVLFLEWISLSYKKSYFCRPLPTLRWRCRPWGPGRQLSVWYNVRIYQEGL